MSHTGEMDSINLFPVLIHSFFHSFTKYPLSPQYVMCYALR